MNCENKTAPSANSTADSPSTTTSAAGANTTASNCPPKKTVVRQGGTSEPSIQLAGGASSQTAQPKDSAGQLLGTTEENLKKIAGHPLTSDQQDMVNQVHQFMEQTKTAVAAGDMERARTLAWKAQVLSEELAKPQ